MTTPCPGTPSPWPSPPCSHAHHPYCCMWRPSWHGPSQGTADSLVIRKPFYSFFQAFGCPQHPGKQVIEICWRKHNIMQGIPMYRLIWNTKLSPFNFYSLLCALKHELEHCWEWAEVRRSRSACRHNYTQTGLTACSFQ